MRGATAHAGTVTPSARPSPLWPFLLLAYAISWTLFLGGWLAEGRTGDLAALRPWITAGTFGPGLAAALLLVVRREGLLAWLRSFVRLRAGWRAYALALLPLPLATLLLTWLLGFAPTEGGELAAHVLALFPLSVLVGLLALLIGAGPLGEEGGWRGYLLPRLLDRHGELAASVLVGLAWALWHLPLMALSEEWRGGVPFALYLPLYTLGVVLLSIVLTRLWTLSGGSLFVCAWFHGVVNQLGTVAFTASDGAAPWLEHWLDLCDDPWDDTARAALFVLAIGLTAAYALLTRPTPPRERTT